MNKWVRKIKSKRGETFVEVLIAILIVAFGCMVIAVMYTTAMHLNLKAAERDDEFYATLTETEQMLEGEPTGSGQVVLQDEKGNLEVTVETFGNDENGAYRKERP